MKKLLLLCFVFAMLDPGPVFSQSERDCPAGVFSAGSDADDRGTAVEGFPEGRGDDDTRKQAADNAVPVNDRVTDDNAGPVLPEPSHNNEGTGRRDKSMPEVIYGDYRELFAMHLSYGGFFPVGPYYYRYNAGHQVSCGTGLYRYNLWGIAPEFLFRYARLDSIESSGRADATFDLFQFSLGLIYRYEFGMPKPWQKYAFFRRKMCFFARVTEGVTLVHYDAENEDHALDEAINTLGLGAGLTYPVWKELRLGFELGYRVIFTKTNYLQGMVFALVVEYRV